MMMRMKCPASRSCVVWMLVLVVMTLGAGRGVDAVPPAAVPDWSDVGYAWPRGTYAVPVSVDGKCPGYDEEEWQIGQLQQNFVEEWREELGRRAADGLGEGGKSGGGREAEPGDEAAEAYLLVINRAQTRNSFCTKTVPGPSSYFQFMPGRYCLWKKGLCPVGFDEGWIQLDAAPSAAVYSSTGALPDGRYDNLTVSMGFCCRADGHPTGAPIRLPDVRPFALLRLGHSPCPAVENMDVSDGWSTWKGLATVSDGLHPAIDVGGDGGDLELVVTSNRTRVFHCVYRPRGCTGRCMAVFYDVFCACFVACVVVFGVCVQLRKRCDRGRRTRRPATGGRRPSSKIHLFYDEDTEEGDEESSVGNEPLLPPYDRRRCPLNRDGGQAAMRDDVAVDSSSSGAVLVARPPSQHSTDDDDEEEDEDGEDVAWDVTVFVQLPQQPSRHLVPEGGTDDARPADAAAAAGRDSPPPPYEETPGKMESPAAVSDDEEDGSSPPLTQEPPQRQPV